MKNRELEYRYTIPIQNIGINPPDMLCDFSLVSRSIVDLEDILVERRNTSLKSEKIGLRTRKTSAIYEITYKKFLDEKNGLKTFEEIDKEITLDDFESIKKGDFSAFTFSQMAEILEKGELYILVFLENKRRVFDYEKNGCKLELIIEELNYSNKARDAMIEIEVKSDIVDLPSITDFVVSIQELFDTKYSDEGKNSRAMKLLGISYE